MFTKLKYLTFLILLCIFFFLSKNNVFAQSVLMEDDFNDLVFEPEWQLKNFALEEIGTYSVYPELNLSNYEGGIRIQGNGSISTIPAGNGYAGWLGQALLTTNEFNPASFDNIILETKLKVFSANEQFQAHVFAETDSGNRIIFNFGKHFVDNGLTSGTQLQFDEFSNWKCMTNDLSEENSWGCYSTPYDFNFNQYYTITLKFDLKNKIITSYVNGDQVNIGIYNGKIGNLKFGIATTVREPNEYVDSFFDDFKLTADPSSTPTVTPIPGTVNLNVPDIKQYSAPWGNQIYANATAWSPSNPTVSRWGCALTSASMIFNFYGAQSSPEILNNWLKASNGYTRNGGVMWPALTRWYRNNKPSNSKLLEFSYLNPSDTLLKNEITEGRPVILKMLKNGASTHFIVGKGFQSDDFYVNDPASQSDKVNTLSQAKTKWGTPIKFGRFLPSSTDLSYIVLLINDGFDLKVRDNSGNEVDGFTEKEFPITPADEEESGSAKTLNAYYFAKPESGNYKILVSGIGVYQLDFYLFTSQANSRLTKYYGSLNSEAAETEIELLYNKDTIMLSSTPLTPSSLGSIKSDIKAAYEASQINDHELYMSLLRQTENAEKFEGRSKYILATIHLYNGLFLLEANTPQKIDDETSLILQMKLVNYINLLKNKF